MRRGRGGSVRDTHGAPEQKDGAEAGLDVEGFLGRGGGGALDIVGGPELALEEDGEKEEEPSRVMPFKDPEEKAVSSRTSDTRKLGGW